MYFSLTIYNETFTHFIHSLYVKNVHHQPMLTLLKGKIRELASSIAFQNVLGYPEQFDG